MGYFFSASLACVISHPEVTTETDVSVMRSATTFSGQPNERVAFMLSCEHTPIHVVSCLPKRLPHLSFVRYDVSGVPAERIQDIIETDWTHLLREKRVLNSPNYLRENGKPVVAIWGAQSSQYIVSAVCSIPHPKVLALATATTHPIKSAP